MRLVYRSEKGDFAKGMLSLGDTMAEAAMVALRVAAEEAKTDARASIASAGFSKRWQNALRGDVFPKKGVSLNAAAAIYHKIPYADVFESGATIRGKPTLWVPLSSSPTKIARKRITPAAFVAQVGPLFPMKTKGRSKILAAQMAVSKAAEKRGPPYKVTLPALRRGAAGQGVTVAVPIFVGIDQVSISKKFKVTKSVEDAAKKLAQNYLSALRVDNG